MTEVGKTLHTLVGRVLSGRMDKTITVLVERQEKHPVYKKYIKRSTKLHAHDQENSCKEGDVVEIKGCRPFSKTKAYDLVRVIQRSV